VPVRKIGVFLKQEIRNGIEDTSFLSVNSAPVRKIGVFLKQEIRNGIEHKSFLSVNSAC
jgi:hypothetical protein